MHRLDIHRQLGSPQEDIEAEATPGDVQLCVCIRDCHLDCDFSSDTVAGRLQLGNSAGCLSVVRSRSESLVGKDLQARAWCLQSVAEQNGCNVSLHRISNDELIYQDEFWKRNVEMR